MDACDGHVTQLCTSFNNSYPSRDPASKDVRHKDLEDDSIGECTDISHEQIETKLEGVAADGVTSATVLKCGLRGLSHYQVFT